MRTEILNTRPDERQPPRRRNNLAARRVEPELLDQLPPTSQRAMESRRDLRRVNWWMRKPSSAVKPGMASVSEVIPAVAEL